MRETERERAHRSGGTGGQGEEEEDSLLRRELNMGLDPRSWDPDT